MTLSEEQIKAAILHPDPIVRDVALRYFTLSFSRDPGVMPVAVQAIEKYGWDEAFQYVWMMQNLLQTDETLLWLVGQLEGPGSFSENAAHRIGSIIWHAQAEVLSRHESRLADCKKLDDSSRKIVGDIIRLLPAPGDACWNELENLCEQHDEDSRDFEFDRATRLVEAISREGDAHAGRVLSILSQKITDFEHKSLLWLEVYAAMLAGLIRLESSAPLLAAKLKDDDGDFINEECAYALTRIGGDAAIEAIAMDFHSAPSHYHLYASSALGDMRGENVVATALELLAGQSDVDIRANLIGAAVANFDPRGLQAARRFGFDNLTEYRRGLIATAVLTGADFPELDELREEERERSAVIHRRQGWLIDGFRTMAMRRPEKTFDEAVVEPIKSGQKVGRNDPCPCGSGKKYKKCCLE